MVTKKNLQKFMISYIFFLPTINIENFFLKIALQGDFITFYDNIIKIFYFDYLSVPLLNFFDIFNNYYYKLKEKTL